MREIKYDQPRTNLGVVGEDKRQVPIQLECLGEKLDTLRVLMTDLASQLRACAAVADDLNLQVVSLFEQIEL